MRTWLVVFVLALPVGGASGEVLERTAQDTVTPVELDHGDTLRFTLRSGQVRELTLEDTGAAILERVEPGGIVYHFTCRVWIDGQPMTMERYAGTQESFYEPYVVNGMRIWFDMVRDVFDLIPIRYPRTGNLDAHPRRRARFAVQDATLRVCPEEMLPWYPSENGYIDVGRCYNGDDCWMGAYLGEACHVGLDINHAKGELLTAPIRFDDHFLFHSLAAGQENNRWRGIRRWPNGDVWALQTHHLIDMLVAERSPLAAGTPYATAAGVHIGSHPHTHYEFKIANPGRVGLPADATIDFDDEKETRPLVAHLDPWIVFWQIFEDQKARQGKIHAAMQPLSPARVGERVPFFAAGSRAGSGNAELTYCWAFGDGSTAVGPLAEHTFAHAGVHPVTLIVDDGANRARFTQHITVGAGTQSISCVTLTAADEPGFHPRPVQAMDVYGAPPDDLPHTLRFLARSSRPVPAAKWVEAKNAADGSAFGIGAHIANPRSAPWVKLYIEPKRPPLRMRVEVDASGLAAGEYEAIVRVEGDTSDRIRVVLRVVEEKPADEATVDDRDTGFWATPYFWVGHRFSRCPPDKRGYNGFYRTNGGRAMAGQVARFTPDLEAGRYEVLLSDQTPFRPDTAFNVRVRHRRGDQTVRMRPAESRRIGVFDFDEGTDGFVEIQAADSRGLVIADAVVFKSFQ